MLFAFLETKHMQNIELQNRCEELSRKQTEMLKVYKTTDLKKLKEQLGFERHKCKILQGRLEILSDEQGISLSVQTEKGVECNLDNKVLEKECQRLKDENNQFLEQISQLSSRIETLTNKFDSVSVLDAKKIKGTILEKDKLIAKLQAKLQVKQDIKNESVLDTKKKDNLLKLHDLEIQNRDLVYENQLLLKNNKELKINLEELQSTVLQLSDMLKPNKKDGLVSYQSEFPSEIVVELNKAQTTIQLQAQEIDSLKTKLKELTKASVASERNDNHINEKAVKFASVVKANDAEERILKSNIGENIDENQYAKTNSELRQARLDLIDAKEMFKSHEIEIKGHDNHITYLKKKIRNLQQSLVEREMQKKALASTAEAQNQEIVELKRQYYSKERSNKKAKSDLKIMIEENSKVHKINTELKGNLDDYKLKLQALLLRHKSIQVSFTQTRKDKNSLLDVYKKACEELARLKLILDKYTKRFSIVNLKLKGKSQEIRNLHDLSTDFENKIKAQLIDIKSYQRQIETLSRQIRETNLKMINLETASHRVLKIKSSADLTVKRLLSQEKSLQIEIEDLGSEVGRLKDKLSLSENESSVLNKLLLKERSRNQKLEEMIEKLRKMDAKNLVHIRNQRSQLNKLGNIERRDVQVEKGENLIDETARSLRKLNSMATGESSASEIKDTSPFGKDLSEILSQNRGFNEGLEYTKPIIPFTFEESLNALNGKDLEQQCEELEAMISEQSQIIKGMEFS